MSAFGLCDVRSVSQYIRECLLGDMTSDRLKISDRHLILKSVEKINSKKKSKIDHVDNNIFSI